MDWITGMQKAIDHIEVNLTEELDYGEIAAKAFMSSFHFQRIFTIMYGFSVGEYIRSRRLTLAGNALNSGREKVIDIALKYGYGSPDSFAKAFTRFHGITPSAAREPGAALKSYSRLSIKISLEGGNIMDYIPRHCLSRYRFRRVLRRITGSLRRIPLYNRRCI